MRFNPNFSTSVVSDIGTSDAAFQTAEKQLTSGLRVSQASDDPAAAAALVKSQAESANVDQYTANTESTLSQAQTAGAALSSVVSLLNQAVTIGTEGANGSLSAGERSSLGTDVTGILSSVVSAANATFGGVAVFGGTSGKSTAFVVDSTSSTGYTYQGNSGQNSIPIGDNLSLQTNVPGNTIFTQSGASTLDALSQLATALKSGTTADISTALSSVTTAIAHVSSQQAVYSNTVGTLNAQESYLSQETVTLSAQQTSLVGIDSAVAAENLDTAQINNSAVLAAAAKVLPQSLLNYLK